MLNPFPGLRPFDADENHLFFGRETEIDDLLRRLRSSRFLAVVGASGSGKSSLVRSGLIPALESGFMAGAGSNWRSAIFRPGEDPIGQLAAAVNAPGVLHGPTELAGTNQVLIEATLRRGTLGLADAVRQARMPPGHNLLVIVDQFEELFRFRRNRQISDSRDEAIVFVKLLLEASRRHDLPIYIVLTMRSDFIGDCMDFPGLSEAVNSGLYLVGRMTRDSLRSAITGPVAVAGGTIAARLVNRILNDLGDDQDHLPLVQHALMRTWDHWARGRRSGAPIDIEDYEAIGTIRNALSLHAEEAYREAAAEDGGTTERLFKALTDTFSDMRGVRRPTTVRELAEICEKPAPEVIRVVEIFRREGRSFLMPPATVPLSPGSIVDLSHESLMRCWTRLIAWADEERAAAAFYVRLAQAARWFEQGAAGLWRNPELELAARWQRDNRPSPAWARRYDSAYERALAFLTRSEEEQRRLEAERERERHVKLRRTQRAAGVLAVLLTAAVVLAYVALSERRRAETNLDMARAAVDESLGSADRELSRTGADVPQVEAFRRELLDKAERFYVAFMDQQPRSERARRDLAFAHFRLGDIDRMLEKLDDAAVAYREAVSRFADLARAHPDRPEYRQALASAYNWLGETLRLRGGRSADAEIAYDSAFQLQHALMREHAENTQYRKELARTLYNRGILRTASSEGFRAAESDFREAIRLLEPIAATDDQAAQHAARAYNNLASLLAYPAAQEHVDGAAAEAAPLYTRAIALHERLVESDRNNREYKLELAKFSHNLAVLLHEQGQGEAAIAHSSRAHDLIEELARLSPSLAIERADAHNVRAWILESRDPAAAEREYAQALEFFVSARRDRQSYRVPAFHVRFGDLLVNLAEFPTRATDPDNARRLLSRAVAAYAQIARTIVDSGSLSEVEHALTTVSRVLPALPESEKRELTAVSRQLQSAVNKRDGGN